MKKKIPDDFFDDEEKDDDKYAFAIDALKCFTDQYEPAIETTLTDLFSSKEIARIVEDHTGVHLSVSDLSATLSSMDYKYKLEENNFMWMVRKES